MRPATAVLPLPRRIHGHVRRHVHRHRKVRGWRDQCRELRSPLDAVKDAAVPLPTVMSPTANPFTWLQEGDRRQREGGRARHRNSSVIVTVGFALSTT